MNAIISLVFLFFGQFDNVKITKAIEDGDYTYSYAVARCASVSILSYNAVLDSIDEIENGYLLLFINEDLAEFWLETASNEKIPMELIIALYYEYINVVSDTTELYVAEDSIYARDYLYCLNGMVEYMIDSEKIET